jgi:hypothetical protein
MKRYVKRTALGIVAIVTATAPFLFGPARPAAAFDVRSSGLL